jgi:uncharacterized protein (DUF1499 family)
LRWPTVLGLLALPVPGVVAGQAAWLTGRTPTDLGVHEGRLKSPPATPNCVSSQTDLWPGLAHRELARVRAIIVGMPGATLVSERPDYLYLQFRSRWLGFVGDVEFWFDPAAQLIQLRSASRLGQRDFGVNRARIEAVRAQLAAR